MRLALARKPVRWLLALLLTLLVVSALLARVVYVLTDHPESVQEAEVSCPAGAPVLRTGQDVKIMSWNVQYLAGRGYVFFYDTLKGDGPDKRPTPASLTRTLKEVQDVIRAENPDVILLQEVDRDSDRTDNQDQLKLIQEGLGDTYRCSASAYYHRAQFVPHPMIMGKVGLSLGVLSKTYILSAARYQLPRICGDPLTVAFNFKRAVLGVSLAVDGDKPRFTVYNTHLDAFAQGCDTMQRQVQHVRDLLKPEDAPWVLGGDFNLLATRAAYERLSVPERTYFNPQTELKLLTHEFASYPSPEDINIGEPSFYTYHGNDPSVGKPDRTIDYFFYSENLPRQAERVLQSTFKSSDHAALVTTITLPSQR